MSFCIWKFWASDSSRCLVQKQNCSRCFYSTLENIWPRRYHLFPFFSRLGFNTLMVRTNILFLIFFLKIKKLVSFKEFSICNYPSTNQYVSVLCVLVKMETRNKRHNTLKRKGRKICNYLSILVEYEMFDKLHASVKATWQLIYLMLLIHYYFPKLKQK